jgi:ribose/xylose/arabinose/galactoside ABC-type transport system permease subunit
MAIPPSLAASSPAPAPGGPGGTPEPALPRDFTGRRRQMPLYIWAALSLVLLLAYNLIFKPSFFQLEIADGHLVGSTVYVLHYGSKVMLLSLGMTLVIATGGIDLSVGAVMAIAGGIAALLLCDKNVLTGAPQVPAPLWLALAAGLGAGLLAGLWNGVLIGYVNIQPIVATLILMISGRGLAIYLTNGQAPTLNMPKDAPPALAPIGQFLFIGGGAVGGVFLTIWIVLAMTVLTILLVRRTALGMFFESVGNNSATCEVAGINTRFFKLLAYGFLGFCAAMAGLIDASMNRIGDTNQSGLDIELDAIVAVAIGGTSLVGGRFSILGAVLGAIAMQVLTVTIQSSGINPQYNYVVKAFVVIIICLLQSPKTRGILAKARKAA